MNPVSVPRRSPPPPPPDHPRRGGSQRRRRPCALALAPALVALAAAVAGCAAPAADDGAVPKALRVETARSEHKVYFATDSATLSPVERERLLAFMRGAGPDRGALIRLAGHADERHTDAYNLDLSARRAAAVDGFLRENGFDGAPIERAAFGERVPAVAGSGPEAWRANRRVEVATDRAAVVLPDCPDWGDPAALDFTNRPLPNLGCATATNLGLMVAEPRDLVRGRALGPADGVREAEAVARYREDKVKKLLAREGID